MGFVQSDGELRREKDERRRRIDERNRVFGATNRVNIDNSMQKQKKNKEKGIREGELPVQTSARSDQSEEKKDSIKPVGGREGRRAGAGR